MKSDAAEHVIGNIRELTWFSNVYFFKSVCASSCTISVKTTHIACHPDLFIPNWRDITCVSCVNRISLYYVAQNNSRCIIVVQNVWVFFLYFWMEYLFILDQKASVDFSVVFFSFLNLLTRSDRCLYECSHKSHNLKKNRSEDDSNTAS